MVWATVSTSVMAQNKAPEKAKSADKSKAPAVAAAGGLADYAKPDKISIVRNESAKP